MAIILKKKDIDVGVEILLGKVQRNIFWQDAFDPFMCFFFLKKNRGCVILNTCIFLISCMV